MVKYTIGDALKKGIALLNENKIENPGLDARILLCSVINCDSLHLTIRRDEELSTDDVKKYFSNIERRCNKEPVGYIVEKKEFMSLDFKINHNVLIPRPDTEILVERAIQELENKQSITVIDMCTGSGAIAVSLAKYLPGSVVYGLDISSDALELARHNAYANGVNVTFDIHNVLTPYKGPIADAVISNPPYIPCGDIANLDVDVAGFEPHLALDGGDDGLDFYRAIVENIHTCLKKGGLLAFELGMGQADDVRMIMANKFEKVSTDCDLAGIERVIYGFLK